MRPQAGIGGVNSRRMTARWRAVGRRHHLSQKLGGLALPRKRVHSNADRGRLVCKRTLTRGALALTGHAGANKVSLQGRVSPTRKLSSGAYVLLITASNAGGHSQTRTLSFTIVKQSRAPSPGAPRSRMTPTATSRINGVALLHDKQITWHRRQ